MTTLIPREQDLFMHRFIYFPLLCVGLVCIQESPRRRERGGCVEAVLRVKEASWRVGLHTQESIQEAGGVSTFSSGTTLWYLSIDFFFKKNLFYGHMMLSG